MVNPKHNTLLEQLPHADFQHLQPHLQLLSLTAGEQLYASGDPIHKVHFPVSALITLTRELHDGSRIDTALLGSQDMLGVRGLIDESSLHSVYVAASGLAYQMPLKVIQLALRERPPIHQMCMKAGNAILKRISVETACAHFHCIEQRLARWLLTRQDHLDCNPIQATHQTIADSLGVRREAITLACRKLGCVQPQHGYIQLTDRNALEKLACDCYFSESETLTDQFTPSGRNAT